MAPTRRLALVAILLLVAATAACGDDSPDTVTPRDTARSTIPDEAGGSEGGDAGDTAVCSAAELEGVTLSQSPELPTAVAIVRQDIVDAAVACDYLELASIATTDEFSYSFGADGDPAGYWQELEEEQGAEPLKTLVELLDGTYATVENQDRTIYVWPPEAVEQDEHLGHRVGIDDGGDWLYFVAGD